MGIIFRLISKFGDDEAILAESAPPLQFMVNKECDTANKSGMKVNAAKTKVMVTAGNKGGVKPIA